MRVNGKPLEVLAPAGKPETLEAAVRAGADAVYLGAQSFSARAGAQNFSEEELKAAAAYCHGRGVRLHLTVNTLLREEELPQALSLLAFACALPADAVLVQDLGLFYFLRASCPELPVHASTQMSLHTPAGVRLVQRLDFSRAVLSRELSLKEIAEIRDGCPGMELEAFVHGALCMSVSGQCYFSAMLGSRSGNRGQCAQTCRLPFAAPGGTGHDLSLKDLSMIPRVRELSDAGIMSFKIEGRMKRPEYVAAAVHACRLAADGEPVPEDLLGDLKSVFSRSGFTTGYPDGKRGRDMFGVRGAEDAASSKEVFPRLHTLYKNEAQRVPVTLSLTVRPGEPMRLSAGDGEGHAVTAEGPVPETALHRPLSEDRCAEQLSKTGGMPFYAGKITCDLADGLTAPMSAVNALRREALDRLLEVRAQVPPVPFALKTAALLPHEAGKLRLRAHFPDCEVPEEASLCERIYVPCGAALSDLRILRERGFSVGLELPRGLFGLEAPMKAALLEAKEAGFSDVWAGTLDGAALGLEAGMAVHGGYSLNLMNSAALALCEELGLKDAEVSFELPLRDAGNLGGALPRGTLIYGRQALMLTRCCPIANGGACEKRPGRSGCRETKYLTDRMGVKFPVLCSGACSEVLNSVPLSLLGRLTEVKNMEFGSLRFTTEPVSERGRILRLAKEDAPYDGALTRGLSYRGVL